MREEAYVNVAKGDYKDAADELNEAAEIDPAGNADPKVAKARYDNRSRKEIACELGISDRAVEGRMGTVLENLRKRVGKFGPVPEMDCLRLVVSRPGAIETLRRAG